MPIRLHSERTQGTTHSRWLHTKGPCGARGPCTAAPFDGQGSGGSSGLRSRRPKQRTVGQEERSRLGSLAASRVELGPTNCPVRRRCLYTWVHFFAMVKVVRGLCHTHTRTHTHTHTHAHTHTPNTSIPPPPARHHTFWVHQDSTNARRDEKTVTRCVALPPVTTEVQHRSATRGQGSMKGVERSLHGLLASVHLQAHKKATARGP